MGGLGCLFALLAVSLVSGCGQVDISFVVDSSSQVGSQGFHNEVQFLLALSIKIGLSPGGPYLAGVVYANTTETSVFLPFTSDPSEAVIALNNLTYYDGHSAIGAGLSVAGNETNGRAGVSRVFVLASGSYNTEGENPILAANILKSKGYTIIVVGAAECDTNTLQKIASSTSDYYYVQTWTAALAIIPSIINQICGNAPSTTSTSTGPYTNTGPGCVSCGRNKCSPTSQCCSDDEHSGSDFYCCLGEGSCCLGSCCSAGYMCDTNSKTCVSGGGMSTGSPYTTTEGSKRCGWNFCAPGSQCCTDDSHPGSDDYCCLGSETCCRGQCCGGSWNCQNGACSSRLWW